LFDYSPGIQWFLGECTLTLVDAFCSGVVGKGD
jgi:hypothetical protein